MSMTDRLALPLIAAGQAQKEMTHNEALAALDIAVQPVVEAVSVDTPPVSPLPGQCWIVGPAAAGAWAGQARALAGWTASGWRFLTPMAGWTAWDKDNGVLARYDGTDWISGVVSATSIDIGGVQVVAARQDAIALPMGGAIIDAEVRASFAMLVSALQAHGLLAA